MFFYTRIGRFKLDPEVRAAVEGAAARLEREGFTVEEWAPRALSRGARIWEAMVLSVEDAAPFAEVLGNGRSIDLARQALLHLMGKSDHTLPALGLAILGKAARLNRFGRRELVETGRALRAEIHERLGDDGVLISPTYSRPAPEHGWMRWHPFDWVYSGIYNVLEMPSTTVPVSVSRDGLPIGLQVAAAHGNDGLCFDVASWLEKPGMTPQASKR